MTQNDNGTGRPAFTPPSLAELMTGYLREQTEAHASGLAAVSAAGEVQPYEAGPVQPVDARSAWRESLAAMRLFGCADDAAAIAAPPDWPTLVATHEPVFALALCVGNFPQLVRNLHPLLQAKNLSGLRHQTAGRPVFVPALVEWSGKKGTPRNFVQIVLTAGCLRLAREFDRAAALLQDAEKHLPSTGQALLDNEKAALAWQRGETDAARQLWLAQPESAVVLFNRGMSALFLDEPARAQADLTRAVAQLPERSAWHHLGHLYLTLSAIAGRA